MSQVSQSVTRLIDEFAKLPGIGKKSAGTSVGWMSVRWTSSPPHKTRCVAGRHGGDRRCFGGLEVHRTIHGSTFNKLHILVARGVLIGLSAQRKRIMANDCLAG